MESLIRFSFFMGTFVLMGLWELWKPKLKLNNLRRIRWPQNIAIILFNTALMTTFMWLIPLKDVLYSSSFGLWSMLSVPLWAQIIVSIVVFDLVIYSQHRVFHRSPLLWNIHMVHHVDHDYDLTTALRFHPIEIFISLGVKLITIFLLGAPFEAVIIFEIVLNSAAMFNHGNIELPNRVDHLLRNVIVTPDMHRIHHSVVSNETNSNYGFNIPFWDYLFGTYCHVSKSDPIQVGLPNYQSGKRQMFLWLIGLPFFKRKINK